MRGICQWAVIKPKSPFLFIYSRSDSKRYAERYFIPHIDSVLMTDDHIVLQAKSTEVLRFKPLSDFRHWCQAIGNAVHYFKNKNSHNHNDMTTTGSVESSSTCKNMGPLKDSGYDSFETGSKYCALKKKKRTFNKGSSQIEDVLECGGVLDPEISPLLEGDEEGSELWAEGEEEYEVVDLINTHRITQSSLGRTDEL